jgi:cytochrome c oxidase subunit 2
MALAIPLFPEQASTAAGRVDALYFFLIAISLVGATIVGSLLVFFAYRYRKASKADRTNAPTHHTGLELFWTAVPLVVFLVIFFWSASVYFHLSRPPDDAVVVQVLGKRWMWKLQHPNGRREINELHVPVGQAVRLNMTSEDVIHSFYVPAFRIKADVLPGRYTTAWFEATKPGRYHLFCAEYCGTKHSQMGGSIIVMEPADYETWLRGEGEGLSLADAGEALFQRMGCVTCHNPESEKKRRGPMLDGLFGKEVRLKTGEMVVADENYLRESIVTPKAKMVEGYAPLMPTFQGLINEEGIMQLIEYIKSIGPKEEEEPSPEATAMEIEGAGS